MMFADPESQVNKQKPFIPRKPMTIEINRAHPMVSILERLELITVASLFGNVIAQYTKLE